MASVARATSRTPESLSSAKCARNNRVRELPHLLLNGTPQGVGSLYVPTEAPRRALLCSDVDLYQDIVFTRGSTRLAVRTERFYAFINAMVPLFQACNTIQRKVLVRCITQGYHHGRFIKRERDQTCRVLRPDEADNQIILALRAKITAARQKPQPRKKRNREFPPGALKMSAVESLVAIKRQNDSSSVDEPPHEFIKLPAEQNYSLSPRAKEVFRDMIAGLDECQRELFARHVLNFEDHLDQWS